MERKADKWLVAPTLGVRDVRKTAAYFERTLGFEFGPNGVYAGVGDEGAVYAIGWRGGASIHIQIRRRPLHLEERAPHEGDAYFYVDDVDALFAELKAKGAVFHRELQDEEYGMRDFTVETPDGHRIAFGTAKA